MERRVEACDLRQVWQLGEENFDRLDRKRLVQRREGDVAPEVGQHARVDAHRRRILAAAVHDAVSHRRRRSATRLPFDAGSDTLQRRVVRPFIAQHER